MRLFSLSRTAQRFAKGGEEGRASKNHHLVRHVVTLALLAIVIAAVAVLSLSVVQAATPYGWAATTSDVSPVRSGAAVAQDGTVSPSQVLLFGGTGSKGALADTWRWNGTTWAKLSPSTSPAARSGATLVYDPVHHQDVLFGGSGSSGLLNDTWVWNGTTWAKLAPSNSPAARQNASTVWDSVRNVVVLFGGASKNSQLQDTWTWNGSTWTQLSPSTKPPARSGAAAAFDVLSGTMILFGGTGSKGALADTWRWDGTTWTQLAMTTSPSARTGAGAAFDPITNQIVLFGGLSSAENNDTWTFGATTWTKLSPAQAPSARDSFGFATGGDGSLVLVDGKSGKTAASGTWVWQTTPGAPQSVTATAQNRQATVSWSAPLSGGSPITSYTVTASPGGATATSTSTSAIVTGLQVATTYTFTVTATNALGTGAVSATSNSTTTWAYPSAPQNVTATAGNAQATVSWQAPASNGGSVITGYTVTPYIGTAAQPATNVNGSTLSTTITGLTNGTTYTFAVTATTAVGTGPAGTTPAVTPVTVPGPPQNVSAVAGNAQATVSWQAPASNGGSAITGYVVTTFIGATQQSTTTVDASTLSTTLTGLNNGTTYTFTVAATNAAGTGPSASTSAAPSNLPSAPQNVSAAGGSDRVTVSWQVPASDGGSPITSYTVTPYQGTTALAPVTATTSPVTVTGLTGSTTYTFSVAATNANGTGAAATSPPVTTAFTPCPVAGATDVWTGVAGSTSWTDASNWSAGHQPFSTDVACLPAGTPGTTSISVPATTVKQLISYKPLTIASGLTTTNGADFEANATWTGGTFAGPSVMIGSSATITINGQITLSGSLAVTNAGFVQIVNGTYPIGVSQSCGTGNAASWVNMGTLVFADPGSTAIYLCSGSFTNITGGIVDHTGAGTDAINSAQITNTGSIMSQSGVLVLSTNAGSLTGGTIGGGQGQVVLSGTMSTTPSVIIADNVWVVGSGTLSGTIVISANATLHVGYDSASPTNVNGPAGTVAGTVTGAGTLSAIGHLFDNYPYGSNTATAVVAADLNVANVVLSDYATFATKPDGTTTQIGNSTMVTVSGAVSLAGSVAVNNAGTVQIVDGTTTYYHGLTSPCGASPSWVNTGTITFADSGGASFNLSCGSFTNASGGIVSHTGAGSDYLSAAQLTNNGSVTSSAGLLAMYSPSGSLSSGSVAGSGGQITLSGSFTATSNASEGDNVWVVGQGTLTGTIVIPVNATLHIGYDSASPTNFNGAAGTISGTVTGAGTLSVIGHLFNNYPEGSNTATAVVAADLSVANVVLSDYATLATKPDGTPSQITSSSTVSVVGAVSLAGSVAIVNAGTVQFADGTSTYSHGITSSSCSPGAPLWTNNGTVIFTDSSGAAFDLGCGSFTNTPNGSVIHIATASDYIRAAQLSNSGAVSSNAGLLSLSPTNGSFTGGYVAGGGGQVALSGTLTSTADASFGDNVWLVGQGTLTGTIEIAANATLHIGFDPLDPTNYDGPVGMVAGSVAGAGTLSAIGHQFNNYPYGTNTATAVIAADLNVANVQTADYTTFTVKPDGTPSNISSGTTLTLTTSPTLASNLTLNDFGTINFGTNGYFNCSTCTVTIEQGGAFVLNNPDGSFTHGFFIDSGTFDNEGLIKLTGYLPGTWVVAGPNVTLQNAGLGNGETDGLQQPSWIQNLQANSTLNQIASSLTQSGGLSSLGTKAIMYAVAALKNIGVGQCVNLNVSLGVPGGSVGLCLVVDPAGNEAVAVSVSGGFSGDVSYPPSQDWDASKLLQEPEYSIDAGAMALWKTDPVNGQGFNAYTDLDGLSVCQNGTLVSPDFTGVTGQHCWGPEDGVSFKLGILSTNQPGVHSGYVGLVVGTPGATTGMVLSYSVTLSCAQWDSATGQACPPVNATPPSISGTTSVGSTLQASTGQWTTPDPSQPLSYSYQWGRCTSSSLSSCSPIGGATSNTYTATDADRNYYLTVWVRATNASGTSQAVAATPVGMVQ